jgi:hypothetical protein
LFVTMDGGTGSGFHRHVWDHKEMNCEKSKVALPSSRHAVWKTSYRKALPYSR